MTIASACIVCGQCQIACPQHLPFIGLLAEVAETQFPIDLEKAYELGKRLVAKCKES
ncbi:MAG: 4Fe-4S binding protein [Prevotella sp.]|nr:4Fe-4S binding protein [Prevotella sp.]